VGGNVSGRGLRGSLKINGIGGKNLGQKEKV